MKIRTTTVSESKPQDRRGKVDYSVVESQDQDIPPSELIRKLRSELGPKGIAGPAQGSSPDNMEAYDPDTIYKEEYETPVSTLFKKLKNKFGF